MNNELNSLHISRIALKDFRCFNNKTIDLDNTIVLVSGSNGTGKTSLLEALYYACYLRSFRTNSAKDLIALDRESFFIKVTVQETRQDESIEHTITIGFAQNKRLVKIDNQSTVSYKDLLARYRIISLTEDDLMLVKGGPEYRRIFLDQALLLQDVSLIPLMKEFRLILEQRNSLLQNNTVDQEAYYIWTEKLWEKAFHIQTMRKAILKRLEKEINTMLYACFGDEITISFSYEAKKNSDLPFDYFWKQHETLLKDELYYHRSLFGVHLDDFVISLEGKKSRSFASRGQQKMILLLIKAAQIKQLIKEKGPVIFLLDDFMTDFDEHKGAALLSVLFSLKCQLIFTSPHENSPLEVSIDALGRTYNKISM